MSYICKAGFLIIAMISKNYHMKSKVEWEVRVEVSNLIPKFEKLCSAQQMHTSQLVSTCGYLRVS